MQQQAIQWKAQYAPHEITQEELVNLISPLFSFYRQFHNKRRQSPSEKAAEQTEHFIENPHMNQTHSVESLLEKVYQISPDISCFLRETLEKKKLLYSDFTFPKPPDLYQRWNEHLDRFYFADATSEPTESFTLSPRKAARRYTEIWDEFLSDLESALQQQITSQQAPTQDEVVHCSLENIEYLYDFVDYLDRLSQKKTVQDASVMNQFLDAYCEMWGVVEEKVTEETSFDAMLHEQCGFEAARPGETYPLRVLRRGFRSLDDHRLLRKPNVVVLEYEQEPNQ